MNICAHFAWHRLDHQRLSLQLINNGIDIFETFFRIFIKPVQLLSTTFRLVRAGKTLEGFFDVRDMPQGALQLQLRQAVQ